VAILACDPGLHVGPVVEVNVVGQFVDPLPAESLAAPVGLGDPLDVGAVHLGDRVAVHAGLEGRDARVAGTVRTGVAVLAGDVVVPGVDAVGEGDGLPGA
jgi:hypothetical protein